MSDPLPPLPELPAPTVRDRALALFEVFLCSSVPTQLGLGLVLRAVGMSPIEASGALSRNFVVVLSLGDTALLLLLMTWLMRERGESPRAVWLGSRLVGRDVRDGLLLAPVLLVSVGLLLNFLRLFWPSLQNVPTNPLEGLATTPGNAVVLGLVAIVAGGIREELQRAFLLRRFERYLGGADVGLIVLSTAFGLGHYVQGWDAVITTGILGAIWASMYLSRRSSVAPVVSHAAFNAFEVLRAALL